MSQRLPKTFAAWRVTDHYRLQTVFVKDFLFKQTQLLKMLLLLSIFSYLNPEHQ